MASDDDKFELIYIDRIKPTVAGVCSQHMFEFLNNKDRIYQFKFGDSFDCNRLVQSCDHEACKNDIIQRSLCSEIADRIKDNISCYDLIEITEKTYDDPDPSQIYYYLSVKPIEDFDLKDAMQYYQELFDIQADGCDKCSTHTAACSVRLGKLLNFDNITCERHALNAIGREVFYSNNMTVWEQFNRKRYTCEHPTCAKNPLARRKCFETSSDNITVFDVLNAHISFNYETRGNVTLDVVPLSKFRHPANVAQNAAEFQRKVAMYHDPTCRHCDCMKQNVAGMRSMMHFIGVMEHDGWKLAGDD